MPRSGSGLGTARDPEAALVPSLWLWHPPAVHSKASHFRFNLIAMTALFACLSLGRPTPQAGKNASIVTPKESSSHTRNAL